jgi:hypothetical protein
MTKGQFALLTAALGLVTMGGAGYFAYASSTAHAAAGGGASAAGQPSSGGAGVVTLPTGAASPSADQGATGAAGAQAGVRACQNGEVSVTEEPGQGAAGHVSLLLVFQNTSGQTCTLRGYPGASLVDQKNRDLLDASRTLTGHLGGAVGFSKPPVVVLASGAQASAVLEWSDVATSSGCEVQNPAGLLVTPPNTKVSTPLSLAAGSEVCGEFQIHPVLKGVLSEP